MSRLGFEVTTELKDLLDKKRPYRNSITNEIRYLTVYEKYMFGIMLHPDVWVEISETATIKVLYAPKEEKKA